MTTKTNQSHAGYQHVQNSGVPEYIPHDQKSPGPYSHGQQYEFNHSSEEKSSHIYYSTSPGDGTPYSTTPARTYSPGEKMGDAYELLSYPNSNMNFRRTSTFSKEKPKKVLQKGFGFAAYLIHIITLGISAAVLQLSFRFVYWSDDDKWNENRWTLGLSQEEVSNMLQFPAKIHEIFIVTSMSAIIFAIIRRMLIGRRGVPFGLLMGGYQIYSAEYLFSSGFWGPLTYAMWKKKIGMLALSAFIGIAIVYANVVGPCSAVLVVPSLKWWHVPDPFDSRLLTSYVTGPATNVFPTELTSADATWYSDDCSTSNLTSVCPGGGTHDIRELAHAYAKEGVPPTISMAATYGRARRNLWATHFKDTASVNSSSVVMASTVHADIIELVGLFWHYVNSNDGIGLINEIGRPRLTPRKGDKIFSPIVQVQCESVDYYLAREGSVNVTFPMHLLDGFTPTPDMAPGAFAPPVPAMYWDFDHAYNSTNFTWIDLQNMEWEGQKLYSSIAALTSLPYITPYTNDEGLVWFEQSSLLVTCVLDARWAGTEIAYDPVVNDLVITNITNLLNFQDASKDEKVRAKYGIGSYIPIGPPWADLLNPAGIWSWSKNYTELNELPAIEAIFSQFTTSGYANITVSGQDPSDIREDTFRVFGPPTWGALATYEKHVSETVSTMLSLVLADGLSRLSYDWYIYVTMLEDSNPNKLVSVDLYTQAGEANITRLYSNRTAWDLDNWVTLTFEVQRYGWGYGISSKTVIFAISIILLHAAVAISYVIFGIWHWARSRWYSSSWGSIGELVALATLSRETRGLYGTGGGISKWDTWKLDVRIRETGTERVELLFGDRDGVKAWGDHNIIQPGRKYR
ncbi:uncharacterized protein BCR38DRAFT_478152 [Pseudomassariella vexata]|uniref:Uncharacterized protein n=1 Tax=Pseudomassariella vexata TaxID=1141098 RepID=A0A1Y2DF01_9PEZI|nr:uncharacterized protein BCR38DRAFT_478152 [Pseudomassariella vexata]ORY57863.1 hypothetical protein BCR38DRAFT_478152 [Pseudomassariella vexata]